MAELPRVVVDTSVVLDLLLDQDPDRAKRAEYLLAGHGERHVVVLPAIVIAEIGGDPETRPDGDPAAREARMAKALGWLDSADYLPAELTARTARRAAELGARYRIKGADAAVLATAEHVGATHVYTRDSGLLRRDGHAGIKVQKPEDIPYALPDLLELIEVDNEPPQLPPS